MSFSIGIFPVKVTRPFTSKLVDQVRHRAPVGGAAVDDGQGHLVLRQGHRFQEIDDPLLPVLDVPDENDAVLFFFTPFTG